MNELDRIALDKAHRALQRGFDGEAYLVLCMAEKRLRKANEKETVDLIPESTVDENIASMSDEFVKFMQIKNQFRNGQESEKKMIQSLDELLSYMKQIITELYETADVPEERSRIHYFKTKINSIFEKNSL